MRSVPTYPAVSILLLALAHSGSVSGRRHTDRFSQCPARCTCRGPEADCSFSDLTYVPRLPDRATLLNFTFNDLRHIDGQGFFLNATSITGLCVGNNNLTRVAADAFRLLRSLTYLSLPFNPDLGNSALPAVAAVSTLRKLDLRLAGLRNLPRDIFYANPLPYLKTIYLFQNHLTYLNLSGFSPLGRLRTLEVGTNKIRRLDSGHLKELETLHVGFNRLSSFPATCKNGTSMFPRLKRLFLYANLISSIPGDVCLPELRFLELGSNLITSLSSDMFSDRLFPKLIELYLDKTHRRIRDIAKYAFRNSALQKISLMSNFLNFGRVVDLECFSGCANLTNLLLSHNFFGGLDDMQWRLLLGNLTKLEYVYIDNGQINHFPVALSEFVSMRTLSLSGNRIRDIPESAFDRLGQIETIKLDSNQISGIREKTFSASTRQRLSHLDLSGNPFTCSCDLMWFRQWLVSNPELFRHSWTSYQCSNLAHTNVTSFYMAHQACLMSRDAYAFIAVSVAMLISTLTLVSLFFRYRWHLRLLVYEAFRGRGEARRRRLQQQHFRYDVFVCYAFEDVGWIRQHLMPEIEERLGLRLCIHERDFTPGEPIVDNIEESVQASKKVMMVFSTHFARSEWCQFELRLSLSHVMEHDDALLVVLLQDVPPQDMTSTMMAVLKTTTYIEWGQEPDARASFWGRIQISLNEILSHFGVP